MPYVNHAMNGAVDALTDLRPADRCGCPDAVAFGEALDDLCAAVDTYAEQDNSELRAALAVVDGAWHEFQRLYWSDEDEDTVAPCGECERRAGR